MADYTTQIVRVLFEAGEKGIRIRMLARHVFNAVNSFFEPVEFEEVYRSVAVFVPAHAKGRQPLFLKCSHGVYRLNMKSEKVLRMLMEANLHFDPSLDKENGGSSTHPAQLFLFTDDFFS